MPRILPRLIKALARNPFGPETYHGPLTRHHRRRRSLWTPPKNGPSLSITARSHSFLLDLSTPGSYRKDFKRHKSLPPMVKLGVTQNKIIQGEDRPRVMSEQEQSWWSSPYLRMLSSPVRKCILTQRLLPTDFLVRLVVMRMPPTRISRERRTVLLPDGIQHEKFKPRLSGAGHYVVCWKSAIPALAERGTYKRLSSKIVMHSLMIAQIGHLLRLRVLQELILLINDIRDSDWSSAESTVLRRLTRSEWASMKTTGIVPWESAIAVLVVPPPNKDLKSRKRPEPNLLDVPVAEDDSRDPSELPPLPPLSTLCLSTLPLYDDGEEYTGGDLLPHLRIPLYNGLSLFPSRTQRAALHLNLSRILRMERNARWLQDPNTRTSERKSASGRTGGNEKASHAYVLFSDARNVKRVDSAATAIALWRVRMWEGAGSDDKIGWQEKMSKSSEEDRV